MEKSATIKSSLLIALLFTLSICNLPGASYHAGNCEKEPLIYLSEIDSVNPVEVFDQVWQIFNTNYP